MELRKLAGLPIPKPKPKPKEGEHKRGKHKKKWEEPETAVFGGLMAALGLLFTSFASQFHQLFLSYGLVLGE